LTGPVAALDRHLHMTRAPRALLLPGALIVLVALVAIAPRQVSAQEGGEYRVLQLNLCHSGHVSCYTGADAIAQARAVIEGEQPDVVSLNEVCRSDVDALAVPGYQGWFTPARTPSGATVKCTSGEDYGIGLLHRAARTSAVSNTYAAQDSGNERRVWMCSAFADGTGACATHLSTSSSTAMRQCHELLDINRPAHIGGLAAVIAGDFNLRYNRWIPWQPNVQDCVPGGFFRKGDGSVQHVMASSAHFDFIATEVIDMQGTTDHPALLVRLTRR
jgi:Endonuclease/Exonuclease/phosphatase family